MRPVKRLPKTQRELNSLGDSRTALTPSSLALIRLSGILLFAFSVVIFGVNLPAQVASLQDLFQAAFSPALPFNTDIASSLRALGVSESRYVIFNMALFVAAALASFLVSGLILWRRADDRVAILGAAMLLSIGVVGPTTLTGAFSALVPTWPWHVFSQCLIFIAGLSFPLFFLLFPSGYFVPRWTRWLLIGILPLVFFYAFFPQVLFSSLLSPVRFAATVGLSLCLAVAQVYRYLQVSSPSERQQTKWVSLGVIGGLVINSLGNISLWFLSSLHLTTATHAFFFTPVTAFFILLGPFYVGMAITRSHLWSIDLIIRRTLIYSLLTVLLSGLYLLLVFGGQYLLASFFGPGNAVVLVVSTLIVAALFQPLRQRVQQLVDQRFYRSRYDATQILADFSETLRQEVDPDQLCTHVLTVVQQTMQPSSLSLWLCPRKPQEKLQQPEEKLPPP
jgi:hypothetical protein